MTRLLPLILLVTMCCVDAVAQWALPHISVAHVRTEPRHSAEMSTQALMGMPLKVIEDVDGWYEVEMPDGYRGYIISNSLTKYDDSEMRLWRSTPRLFVTSYEEVKVLADSVSTADVVSDVVAGDILAGILAAEWSEVVIPDGRRGWIKSEYVRPLDSVFVEDAGPEVVKIAKRHIGSPYLWGGLSSKGMDCSGLVKMAYYNTGRILMRDASQQADTGIAVSDDDFKPGDLIFFGNASGRINHVGIYDSDGYFIESAGRVKRTSLDEKEGYIAVRRIIGYEDTSGISVINAHPWYFD